MPRKQFEKLGSEESVKRRVLNTVIFCPKEGITINDCNEKNCPFNKGVLKQNGKKYVLCSYRSE